MVLSPPFFFLFNLISISFALEQAPYVHFLRPVDGECIQPFTEIFINWNLIIHGDENNVQHFARMHDQSQICISTGSSDRQHCISIHNQETISLVGFPPGCHLVVAWWEDLKYNISGPAMSKSIIVGDSCQKGCLLTQDQEADEMMIAYPDLPPNRITGGCLKGDACSARCLNGCCEATSPLSMCQHASTPIAEGSRHPHLPFCSECLVEVSPPNHHLLPRYNDINGHIRRYISLVRETVLNSPYEDPDHANFDTLRALTMVGRRRIDHLDALIQDVLYRNVKGHFIECGCWRGGVGLFAAAALLVYDNPTNKFNGLRYSDDNEERNVKERVAYLADSFDGLPPVNTESFPSDAAHLGSNDDIALLKSNSVEVVERAAKALDVLDNVRILKGFFNESLPKALQQGVFMNQPDFFSIIRLDGDLYQSTIESLHYLYPLLSIGGFVVVDDFTDWKGTRDAVLDYRERHSLTERLEVTWHDLTKDPLRGEQTRSVWWMKTKHVNYDPLTSLVDYAQGSVLFTPY